MIKSDSVGDCVIGCVTDCMIVCLSDYVSYCARNCVIDCLSDCVKNCVSDSARDCVSNQICDSSRDWFSVVEWVSNLVSEWLSECWVSDWVSDWVRDLSICLSVCLLSILSLSPLSLQLFSEGSHWFTAGDPTKTPNTFWGGGEPRSKHGFCACGMESNCGGLDSSQGQRSRWSKSKKT